MRSAALIRENVDGMDDLANKFVMRAVPHVFALATSTTPEPIPTDGTTRPPDGRVGWSGDGAPGSGTLRDFQTGAINQHYPRTLARVDGVDFVQATPAELDAIVAFLGTIGRTNDIQIASVALTDAGAEAGRLRFQDADARCNGCHRNASANTSSGFNKNFNTGMNQLRIAGTPSDGGFGRAPDGSGAFGTGTFNTPPLIEAADTGPWFHNNAFTGQIENAIAFYTTPAFAASPAGNGVAVPLSAADVANIGRFLRVLNAAMNVQLAVARTNAEITILNGSNGNQNSDVEETLAALASNEVRDALTDLSSVSGLNTAVQVLLQSAIASLQTAATHASHVHRLSAAQDALSALDAANVGLGTGMVFAMGPGSLMF